MKSRYSRCVYMAPIVMVLVLMLACGGGSSSSNQPSPVSPTLKTITATGASGTLSVGGTLQYTATGTYSDSSTKNLTSSVTWTSSNSGFAQVNAAGLATGIGAGTATITATLNGVAGSSSIQVQPAVVSITSITVLPANPVIELNTTQQLTASGTFSNGSQQDLSHQVTWSSSSPTIATIDPTGLATAVASGPTTISAVMSGITGSTTLTINKPELASIVVDQDGFTVPLGLPQQLTATGVFTDGSTASLIGVTFTSDNPAVVSVDSNGLATTNAVGTANITATVGSVSGTGVLTVGPQTLASIAMSPTNSSIPLGLQQQFTATGTFTDNSTQPLTTGVTWASIDSTVASVDQNGLASSVAAGTTTITATVGALSSSGSLTVTAAQLLSVAVTPGSATIPSGAAQQFTATGTYDDNTTQDLTSIATWVSSNGSFATIDNTGLATAVAPGTVTITATSGGISGTASLVVNTAKLSTLTIAPLDQSVKQGTIVKFTATAHYNDGSTVDVTNQVNWSSSKPSAVSINSSGRARTHKVGTVTIKAKFGSTSGSTTLTVVAPGP